MNGRFVGRVRNPSGLTMESQKNPSYGSTKKIKSEIHSQDNISDFVAENLRKNVKKRYGEKR